MAKKGAGRAAKAQRQQARKVYVRTTEDSSVADDSARVPVASVMTPPPATPVARPAAGASYASARSAAASRRHPTAAPLATDYSYVTRDLKRLGVILAVIAVVMISLTFVLR